MSNALLVSLIILSAFDNAVYHARQANASGRATERALKEQGVTLDFALYMTYMAEETAADYTSCDYIYESDFEDD